MKTLKLTNTIAIIIPIILLLYGFIIDETGFLSISIFNDNYRIFTINYRCYLLDKI